jgi:Sulfotransferase domain
MSTGTRWQRARGHLRRRQLDLFVVGCGKSGTTSLARMFDDYRSGHEVGATRLLPLSTDVLVGRRSPDSSRAKFELRRRHVRYKLEVDSAPFLVPFARTLARIYPHARFVLPIRDCFSWLDSQVDWQHRFPQAPGSLRHERRQALFTPSEFEYAAEDRPLRSLGVLPVAAYLQSWTDVNTAVLDTVPADRLLVVRTEDLDDSTERLATFAGVPPASVHRAHANRNDERSHLVARVPTSFVVEQARTRCSSLMEQYWGPDWPALVTRIAPAPRD